eukprot:7018463-Prymnesium_polylepis.2
MPCLRAPCFTGKVQPIVHVSSHARPPLRPGDRMVVPSKFLKQANKATAASQSWTWLRAQALS